MCRSRVVGNGMRCDRNTMSALSAKNNLPSHVRSNIPPAPLALP